MVPARRKSSVPEAPRRGARRPRWRRQWRRARCQAAVHDAARPDRASACCEMFETMLLARAVDERQWILNRQGREAVPHLVPGPRGLGRRQRVCARPRRATSWCPYYRSLAAVLAFGVTPLRRVSVGAGQSRRSDERRPPDARPLRPGARAHPDQRQPGRDPDSARHGRRAGEQDPRRRRRQHRLLRRRRLVQGRLPRGPQLRGDPQAAGDLRVREQPLRDQRARPPSRWPSAAWPTVPWATACSARRSTAPIRWRSIAASRRPPTARGPARARR